MRAKYSPSFLVSAEIPEELFKEVEEIAKKESAARGRTVTPEDVFRKAVKFYSARCVHTHSTRRRPHSKSKPNG